MSVQRTNGRGIARAPAAVRDERRGTPADVRAQVEDLLVDGGRVPIDGRRVGQEFLARDLTLRRVRTVAATSVLHLLKVIKTTDRLVDVVPFRKGDGSINECAHLAGRFERTRPKKTVRYE